MSASTEPFSMLLRIRSPPHLGVLVPLQPAVPMEDAFSPSSSSLSSFARFPVLISLEFELASPGASVDQFYEHHAFHRVCAALDGQRVESVGRCTPLDQVKDGALSVGFATRGFHRVDVWITDTAGHRVGAGSSSDFYFDTPAQMPTRNNVGGAGAGIPVQRSTGAIARGLAAAAAPPPPLPPSPPPAVPINAHPYHVPSDLLHWPPRAAPGRVLRGLYLGWTGQFNVGDDAMFEACQELFARLGVRRRPAVAVTLLSLHPTTNCDLTGHLFATRGVAYQKDASTTPSGYDFVVHGGGSILNKFEYGCILRHAHDRGVPVFLWGTGVDDRGSLREPQTLASARQIAAQHVFAAGDNLGSWNRDDKKQQIHLDGEWQWLLRTAALAEYGGVRGPLTGLLLSPIKLVPVLGDSGLLAGGLLLAAPRQHTSAERGDRSSSSSSSSSSSNSSSSTEHFKFWHHLGVPTDQPIVVVNYGTNSAEPAIYHSRQDVLLMVFGATVRALIHHGYTVVVFAMYSEDLSATRALFDLAKQPTVSATTKDGSGAGAKAEAGAGSGVTTGTELGENLVKATAGVMEHVQDRSARGNRLHWVHKLLDTRGLLELLRASHLSLNYKLHGSILSASVGTPFVAVAYHFKMFDFVDSFDIDGRDAVEELIVRSDKLQALGPTAGAQHLLSLVRRADADRQAVRRILLGEVNRTGRRYVAAVNSFVGKVVARSSGTVSGRA